MVHVVLDWPHKKLGTYSECMEDFKQRRDVFGFTFSNYRYFVWKNKRRLAGDWQWHRQEMVARPQVLREEISEAN